MADTQQPKHPEVSVSISPLAAASLAAAPSRWAQAKARALARQAERQAAAATAPAPPVPPATRPRVIQTAIIPGARQAVITMGMPEADDESPLPVDPPATTSKLDEARAEVLRCRASGDEAYRRQKPIEDKLAALQARQAELTATRARVETTAELRAIKEELAEVEAETEILTRQHRSLADVSRSVNDGLAKAQQAYEYVREKAVHLLGRCRAHHFRGNDAKQKAVLLADLTALIGSAEVEKCVLSLTTQDHHEIARHNPDWFAQRGVL